MHMGTPGWGQGVFLILALRSAAGVLTQLERDFVPRRRLQTRAVTSFYDSMILSLLVP